MARIGARAAALAKQAVTEAAAVAGEGAARVRELFPGWRVDARAVGDSPHWGVIKEAHAWNADLVVVGATGRSALGRLVLGSVSRSVVTHAACSVRVGRRAEPHASSPGAPVRLLIGIDRSVGAATAVAAVAARHWPPETEVAIITAIDLQLTTALPMILGPTEALPVEARDEETLVSQSLHRIARELTESGLRVTPVITRGNPKRVLLAEAAARQADCMFVGATGLTRAERLLLGSVSASVANHAPCSVEIVRG
jgi:nucleotide-binding universal stress UspA family protein